jgi:anti-sigma factor RsiW
MSHTDIAAYVLGVLDDRENEAFEEHLFTCARCQVELIEMQIVPEALDELRPSAEGKPRPATGPKAVPNPKPAAPPGKAKTPPAKAPPGKTPPRATPGKFPSAPRNPVTPMPRTPDPVSMPPRPPVNQPVPQLPSGTLTSLLDRASETRKRNRRNALFAAAAAAALIVAGPLVTAAVLGGGSAQNTADGTAEPGERPTTTSSTEPGQVRTGGSPDRRDIVGPVAGPVEPDDGGVRATITLRDRDWGTNVDLELYGVRGPLRCQLVAISRTGEVLTATSFNIPQKGYGVAGFPEPLRVTGGVSSPRDALDRFEVRGADASVLVTVKY